MKGNLWPSLAIVLGCVALFGVLAYVQPRLPERVAMHFGAGGEADGWGSRQGFLRFHLLFGLGLTGFMIALFAGLRFLPRLKVNGPNASYWNRPENAPLLKEMLFSYGLWLSALMLFFVAGLAFVLFQANQSDPPQLGSTLFPVLMVGFVLATLGWTIALILRMSRPPRP